MRNKQGKSFITIMIVTAIFALVLRFAIKHLIETNVAQNQSNAYETLKLISAALENYAKDNKGLYPLNISVLTKTQPSYLDKDYLSPSLLKGYAFACTQLESSGYSCCVVPLRCNLSGKIVYTITTGGSLVSEECSKKEKE